MNILLVLNFQWEGVELLQVVLNIATAHAHVLIHVFSLEYILHQVSLACRLKLIFHSVKEEYHHQGELQVKEWESVMNVLTVYSVGADNCCTSENKCGEWDGDCDSNSVCQTGLICGYNNCPRKYGDNWDLTDNCCFKPDLDTKATCEGIRGGKFRNIKRNTERITFKFLILKYVAFCFW